MLYEYRPRPRKLGDFSSPSPSPSPKKSVPVRSLYISLCSKSCTPDTIVIKPNSQNATTDSSLVEFGPAPLTGSCRVPEPVDGKGAEERKAHDSDGNFEPVVDSLNEVNEIRLSVGIRSNWLYVEN